MKKIILTEQQTKKLMSKVVNEQVPATLAPEYTIDDGRYHITCQFHFQYNDELVTYKGGEIDNIDHGSGDVSFILDINHETYGINGIEVKDIKGPKAIKTQIRYFPEGSSSNDEDWWKKRIEEEVVIPLDWRKPQIDDSGYKMNYIGISKRIDVEIRPDTNGGLIGSQIEITIKNFESEEE